MMNPAASAQRQRPIEIGSQMNYSQTMPQLNYTQHDIREQYMTSSVNLGASTSHIDPNNNNKPTRAQSSDQKKSSRFNATQDSDQWSDNDDRDSTEFHSKTKRNLGNSSQQQQHEEQLQHQHGSRTRTRQEDRKRTRRSRSASLFSSCFHISNLSQQIPARKLKILSHFGLAPSTSASSSNNNNSNNNNNNGQKSTMRTSKTMGHLQQYGSDENSNQANDENHWPSSSGQRTKALAAAPNNQGTPTQGMNRKHVSFGRQQQQQNIIANINSNEPSHSQQDQAMMKPYSQQHQHQQQYSNNNNSNLIRQPQMQEHHLQGANSSSTVIMRNYQAHIRPDNNNNNNSNNININTSNNNNAVNYNNNTISASSSSNNQQQQQTSVITRQPMGLQPTANLLNNNNYEAQSTSYQQQPTLLNQQNNNNNITTITPNKSAQIKPQIATQRASANYGPSKRIPMPMRTQATQTDITAYHLMLATPSSSAGSTLHRREAAGTRKNLLEDENAEIPASSGIVKSQQSQQQQQQQQQQHHEQHNVVHNSALVVSQQASIDCKPANHHRQHHLGPANPSSSRDSESLDLASTTMQDSKKSPPERSSSSSSSNSSLAGHDSALANRLGLVPTTESPTECQAKSSKKTLHQGKHDNEHTSSDVVASRAYPSSSVARLADHHLNEQQQQQQKRPTREKQSVSDAVSDLDLRNNSVFSAWATANAANSATAEPDDATSSRDFVKNKQGGQPHSGSIMGCSDLNATTSGAKAAVAEPANNSDLITRDEANNNESNDDSGDLHDYFASLDPPSEFKDLNTRELVAKKLKLTTEAQFASQEAEHDLDDDDDALGDDRHERDLCKFSPSKSDKHLQRFESQPSLSEASSQTDASLAPNIKNIELGRRISSSICKRQSQTQIEPLATSISKVINDSESWSADDDDDQDAEAHAGPVRGGYATLRNLNTDDSDLTPVRAPSARRLDSFHRTPSATSSDSSASSPSSGSARLSSKRKLSNNKNLPLSAADEHLRASSQTLINQPNRNDDDDGDDDLCDLISSSKATNNSQAKQQQQLNDELPLASRSAAISPSANQRRDDFLQLDELELEASLQTIEKAVATNPSDPLVAAAQQQQQPPPLTRKLSSTSTLSTRHHSYCSSDEFAASQPPAMLAQQPAASILRASQDNASSSQLSNPSTSQMLDAIHLLNEEMELMEPSNDLLSTQAQHLYESPQAPLAAAGQDDNLEVAGASGRGLVGEKAQEVSLIDNDSHEQACKRQAELEASSSQFNALQDLNLAGQRRKSRAEPAEMMPISARKQAEPPKDKRRPTGAEIDSTSVLVANEKAHVIIASSETTPSQQEGEASKCDLRQKANQEGEREQERRQSGSIVCLREASSPSSASSASSSNSSNSNSNSSVNCERRDREARELELGACSGTGVGEANSQANSPMTVSELDELSTPSFLDTYKGRYEQVSQLAEQVVGSALDESIQQPGADSATANLDANSPDDEQTTSANEQQSTIDPNGNNNKRSKLTKASSSAARSVAFKDASPPRESRRHAHSLSKSRSSSPSSESSSSTSVEGAERECCAHSSKGPHPGAAMLSKIVKSETNPELASTSRPPVPKKPAHLSVSVATPAQDRQRRQQSGEAAANEKANAAAAAVAVTATTIAAAAQRHSAQNQISEESVKVLENEETSQERVETTGSIDEQPICCEPSTSRQAQLDMAGLTRTISRDASLASSTSPVQADGQQASAGLLSRSSSLCSSDVSSVIAIRHQQVSTSAETAELLPAKLEATTSPDMDQAQLLATTQQQQPEQESGAELAKPQTMTSRQNDKQRRVKLASEKSRADSLTPTTITTMELGISAHSGAKKRSDSLGLEKKGLDAIARPAAVALASANLQTNDQISTPDNNHDKSHLDKRQHEQSESSSINESVHLPSQAVKIEQQTTKVASNESASSSAAESLKSSKVQSGPDSSSEASQVGVAASTIQQRKQHKVNVVTPIATATSTPTTAGGSRSPVDCPYVHDLLVLSPDPTNGESPFQPAANFQPHAARLSHDDTMEAIEDDVEGEELEQQLLLQQQQLQLQQQLSLSGDRVVCATPPSLPPGFGNSFEMLAAERPLTPADWIKEEDEDVDDFEAPPPPEMPGNSRDEPHEMVISDNDDDDEESSVSVSHRGVLVSSSMNNNTTSVVGPHESAATAATTSLNKQISQNQQEQSEHWPVKSMSNESGTQAILDHMALHQVGVSTGGVNIGNNDETLDGSIQAPEPPIIGAQQLEQQQASFGSSPEPTSSSFVGIKRRKSWRQRANQTDSNTSDTAEDEANNKIPIDKGDHPTANTDANDSINTATMKRRRIKKLSHQDLEAATTPITKDENLSPGEARPNRGPPTPISRNKLNTSDSLETAQGSQEDLALQKQLQMQSEQELQDAGENAKAEARVAGKLTASEPQHRQQQQGVESVDKLTAGVRRGPPLAQLRSGEHGQSQTSAANNNDENEENNQADSTLDNNDTTNTASTSNNNNYDSICSSCSCRDGADSMASGSRQQATTTSGHEGAPQSRTWQSQEEGTVFTENYWLSHWLYISEHEESEIWRRAIDMSAASSAAASTCAIAPELISNLPKEMSELSSTSSEDNFNLKYKSTTRKMIHRRATIEMYRRIQEGRLKPEKRVEINRSNGEFGFRIHGSRPVVVSAIEKGTSAETCGLEVGDLIYAINGTNILEMAHSDVVRLAHNAQSSSLVLDLIPTNEFLRTSKYDPSVNRHYEAHLSGFLMRLSPSTAQPLLVDLQKQLAQSSGSVSTQQRVAKLTRVLRLAWRRRYFVLRNDNCLYWYKSMNEIEPHGGINLQGFSATVTNEFSEPTFVIRLIKYGGQPHYFGTNKQAEMELWIDSINKAATEANQNDPYMGRTLKLARLRPNQIEVPDCNGFLYKYSRKRDGGAHWKPIYFVLKEACLYLFRNGPPSQTSDDLMAAPVASAASTSTSGDQQHQAHQGANQASAVVYLHGYRVRSKQIERKKHTFELIPPTRKTMRPIFLMASSEIDKKRWIAALEYTIDRWIEID